METNFNQIYLQGLIDLLHSFPYRQFEKIVECLKGAYEKERMVFVMGNGGSGATASHFACDMNKGARLSADKRFKVVCLNDNIPTMLAYANDSSYNDIFVEQLKNLFRPGDIVIGISGSGNSVNVLKAIEHASRSGGRTIGICGYKDSKLGRMVELPLCIKSKDMQKIEDLHMIIVHMLMQALGKAACYSLGGVCKK